MTVHVAVPPLRVALTVAESSMSFEIWKVTEFCSITLAKTAQCMGVAAGIADETVIVNWVMILPLVAATVPGLTVAAK